MKRSISHIVTTLVAAVLGLGLALGLAACSNDETEALTAVTTALDAFKNPTEQSLEPYFNASDNETLRKLATSGVDIYDVLGHLLAKYDYAVDEVTVDGDTATAKVTVTNVDLQKVSQTLQDDISSDQGFLGELIAKGTQGDAAGIYGLILDKLYAAIDNTTDLSTADATLQLTKANGTWTVDKDSISQLVSDSFEGLDMGALDQGSWV